MGRNKQKYKDKLSSMWIEKGPTLLQFLLDAGFNVDALNKNGSTMLSYAAECGNLEIAKFLIRNGADANKANSNGFKPIHIAARWGQKDFLMFLLDSGISVDSVGNENCTPLHYLLSKTTISRRKYEEIIQILADSNADLNWRDSKGLTPILCAAKKRRKYTVELLLKLGVKVDCWDENEWNILHWCCCGGWLNALKIILGGKYDLIINAKASDGWSPLALAMLFERTKIVKLLIESGADCKCTDSTGSTLLHYFGSRCLDLDMFKLLENNGCDVNAKNIYGETPVILAAVFYCKPIVNYLIECGVDVKGCNKEGCTLLHLACRNKWLDIVESIIEKNVDVDAQNLEKDTPLHIALKAYRSYGKKDIIKCLLNSGAKCNIENIRGQTAFNIYIINFIIDFEIVSLFIMNGAYFQSEDYFLISNSYLRTIYILNSIPVCTMGILNEFNHKDLLCLYDIPGISETLPSIERLKIGSGSCVAQDIAESVNHDIQTENQCNVLKKRPIGLIRFCVQTLVKHYTSLNIVKVETN